MNVWIEALVTLAVLAGWAFVSSVAADATERPQRPSPVAVQAMAGAPCAAMPSRPPTVAIVHAQRLSRDGQGTCVVR